MALPYFILFVEYDARFVSSYITTYKLHWGVLTLSSNRCVISYCYESRAIDAVSYVCMHIMLTPINKVTQKLHIVIIGGNGMCPTPCILAHHQHLQCATQLFVFSSYLQVLKCLHGDHWVQRCGKGMASRLRNSVLAVGLLGFAAAGVAFPFYWV